MASERIQRQIDRLLDEAEAAFTQRDWVALQERAQDVLALDPEHEDALTFLAAAKRSLAGSHASAAAAPASMPSTQGGPSTRPTSFANGRYQVRRFLGEGGKKKVYLAHDTVLNRDVAAYARFGLDWEATPADFYDARSGKQTRGQDVGVTYWQSIVALANWQSGQLKSIELHPIDLGIGLPAGQRGRPVLAEGAVAREILERFQRMSKPFGTTIEIADGMGVISVS